MILNIAERMNRIKKSGTIAISEKARLLRREGRVIYKLDVGEPDFDTPENIKEAGIEALKQGFTHYTSSRGIYELRQALAEYYLGKGATVNPDREVIVTPGAKHGLFCSD